MWEHIARVKPQIVHFCGHGEKDGLIMDDGKNNYQRVPNEYLVNLFKSYTDRIECVVLNACDTEPLAKALANHINYVIGMNLPVKDESAINFAKYFYGHLGIGEPIEQAFDLAKNEVFRITQSKNSDSQDRKFIVVDDHDNPINNQNQEHLIPVLYANPNPTLIKSLWLSPDQTKKAVEQLLTVIEDSFNKIRLFHTSEPIVLENQYIPVQVTLERRYQDKSERLGGYAESEAEMKKLYALKGMSEEDIKRQQEDWQIAKKKESRIVVLADPGMGKSTLLRMEVIEAVKDSRQILEAGKAVKEVTIPLFIRLSTLADEVQEGLTIKDAILTIIQKRYDSIFLKSDHDTTQNFLKNFLIEQLETAKCLLLLDALDEVPQEKRPQLLEKLNEFVSSYSNVRIIGTSRIVGYAGSLVNGAKEMEIVPFTQAQTEQYIQVWFKTLKEQSVRAEGLIKALQERPQLSGLAQNPLLLSLICSLYQQDQLTLPARRGKIYEKSVNFMLKEWGQNRQSYNQERMKAKVRLLEDLAYYFSSKDQEVFDYDELYDWMEEYLDEGDAPRDLRDAKTGKLITELSREDGILQKLSQSKDNEQYLFLHRTFQEYLTASYLSRRITKDETKGLDLVKSYLWDYDWHETIILLAGLLKKPIVLIQAIMAQKDDIFNTQLLLAGRCLGECDAIEHPIVERIIEDIYAFSLNYQFPEYIQSTLVVLGRVYDRIIDQLHLLLKGSDPYTNYTAIQLLGRINNDQAFTALIQAFNTGHDNKKYAIEQLGKFRCKKAVVILLELLKNQDEDSTIRRDAAYALGEIGSSDAIVGLIEVLNDNNQNVNLRDRAVKALCYVADEQSILALALVSSSWTLETSQYKKFNKASEFEAAFGDDPLGPTFSR